MLGVSLNSNWKEEVNKSYVFIPEQSIKLFETYLRTTQLITFRVERKLIEIQRIKKEIKKICGLTIYEYTDPSFKLENLDTKHLSGKPLIAFQDQWRLLIAESNLLFDIIGCEYMGKLEKFVDSFNEKDRTDLMFIFSIWFVSQGFDKIQDSLYTKPIHSDHVYDYDPQKNNPDLN